MKKKLLLLALLLVFFAACNKPIDRYALVHRHNPEINKVDPLSPFTVGNGEFAFTVDVTGLQSFTDYYYNEGIPLETMSSWAWHTTPNIDNYALEDASEPYEFQWRVLQYARKEKSPAGQYFRKNPHRIPMGRIGMKLLKADGSIATYTDLTAIDQTLDLWTGCITSHFELEGSPVTVETVCHPDRDMIAVRIESSLLKSGKLTPFIHFPFDYDQNIKNKPPIDWDHPELHSTKVNELSDGVLFKRILDDDVYYARLSWNNEKSIITDSKHRFSIPVDGDVLEFDCDFTAEEQTTPLSEFKETLDASANAWQEYWTTGGAIDLSESTEPRAMELERRIVLSQYLLRVNYASTFPPQETGLTHISWYGKHNTEMYWWHMAHFIQWGHIDVVEKSLAWYQSILPVAKDLAEKQGIKGARWPKMTGPHGQPSPGNINPFIIWNQPNVIYLSELIYRVRQDKETLEKYKNLVFESADYLATYAFYNENEKRYTLGPPIKSVSEDHGENNTKNPTFELAYWYYGLSVARQWRERLGLEADPQWDDVYKKLSLLPIQDSLYLDIETNPDIFKDNRKGLSSSMVMALGFLPKTERVDKAIMKNTFDTLKEIQGIDAFVSWTSGKMAMTAARLGETDVAVDILCNTHERARYLPNGHVRRPKEPKNCPAYLPVNCSLLSATALMAAGWDDAPDVNAPGFPQDGSWKVKWEGINPLP